jgi:flagellar motor switch protein FliN/FliY
MSHANVKNFVERFISSFSEALSQASGTHWTASETSPNLEPDALFAVASLSGKLQGEFAFVIPANSVLALAQVLLMAPEPPTAPGPDELEACTEFLRQVCGLAATGLCGEFGDVKIELLKLDTTDPKFCLSSGISLQGPSWSGLVGLALSEPLKAQLDAQICKTDRPALEFAVDSKNLDLLLDVRLGARLRFGSRRMRLREILELNPGSVVELDRQVSDPVDLLVDNKLIARGEVVVVDGNYGLRVTEVAGLRQKLESIC